MIDLMTKPEAFDKAYTAIIDERGYAIGVAEWDVSGYTVPEDAPRFATYMEAEGQAALRNEQLGLTKLEALAIVLSSMRAQNAR